MRFVLGFLWLGLLGPAVVLAGDDQAERAAQLEYLNHVASTHHLLGFSPDVAAASRLRLQFEPDELVAVDRGLNGRRHYLAPEAATAWRVLRQAARLDGISLEIASSFRSVSYQAVVIQRRLDQGIDEERVLYGVALPGYSEHHTGCAIDLTTEAYRSIGHGFGRTESYDWLRKNAAEYGFVESYPPGNSSGIMPEPWHWFYQNCER